MKLRVRLFEVQSVDDAAENSNVGEVHSFGIKEAVAAGTTFVWKGRRFVHYGDFAAGPDEIDLYYMEEQKVIEVPE